MNVFYLECTVCGRQYPSGTRPDVCAHHADLEGILEVRYDVPALKAAGLVDRLGATDETDAFIRYADLLPIADSAALPTGWISRTPLINAPAMAAELGVASLRVKDEGRNPTGSLKDRSSALAVADAVSRSIGDISCASTGNAASSLAGIAANLGLRAHIFVPEATPLAKLEQLHMFGAEVLLVRGSYDDAYYLCREAAREFDWYDRNCATNPFLVEGKKTCGLELAEQLATSPANWVSLAVGDGCTVTAVWKGLKEMHSLGVLDRLPKLLAIQPEGASPIVKAFESMCDAVTPQEAASAADSIAVGRPRNALRAIQAVRESGGRFLSVGDDEMRIWRRRLATRSGIFAELGAAAGIAGIARAVAHGDICVADNVVHISTGTGLKDAGRTSEQRSFLSADPDMRSVREALAGADQV